MKGLIDQFGDLSLAQLDNIVEVATRDKIATSSSFPVGDIKYGTYRSGRLLKELVQVTKHAMSGDPVITRVVRLSKDLPDASFMDAVTSVHLNDARRTFKKLGVRPGHPSLRSVIGRKLRCAGTDGMFPIHNPLQALLSFLYAHSQSPESEVNSMFNEPFIEMFGPKTYNKMKDIVIDIPVEDLTAEDNLEEFTPSTVSAYPTKHTFIPKLLEELSKLNFSLKGSLDDVVGKVDKKYKDTKQITILDSDFQGSLLDELSELLQDTEVKSLTGGKSVKDMIFNTDIDDSFSELIKVRDFIIDKGKLTDLPYSEGAASFSPQVAEAIYTDDKKGIDFESLVSLIERLSDLKVDEGERKEIDERILGPLKLFLEPDEIVVDKIMTIV